MRSGTGETLLACIISPQSPSVFTSPIPSSSPCVPKLLDWGEAMRDVLGPEACVGWLDDPYPRVGAVLLGCIKERSSTIMAFS